jgi:hypothetical protein
LEGRLELVPQLLVLGFELIESMRAAFRLLLLQDEG